MIAGRTANALRDRFWVVGPIGLLLAFFWQPALRLIQPFVLTAVSSLLVLALIAFESALRLDRRPATPIFYWLAGFLGLLGAGEAIYFAAGAFTISEANDRRCEQIEVRMLATTSGRAADAELFQALGCRPQTVKSASWPEIEKASPIMPKTAP